MADLYPVFMNCCPKTSLITLPTYNPILLHCRRPKVLSSQSNSSTKNFVSQSESSITSTESSRLESKTLLGSRVLSGLVIAYLKTYIGSPNPLPPHLVCSPFYYYGWYELVKIIKKQRHDTLKNHFFKIVLNSSNSFLVAINVLIH